MRITSTEFPFTKDEPRGIMNSATPDDFDRLLDTVEAVDNGYRKFTRRRPDHTRRDQG